MREECLVFTAMFRSDRADEHIWPEEKLVHCLENNNNYTAILRETYKAPATMSCHMVNHMTMSENRKARNTQ